MVAPKKKKYSDPGVTVDTSAAFKKLLKDKKGSVADYLLCLYVTGITLRSTEAICNIRSLCEEYLKGHYQLEIVDIYQQPAQAMAEQIIAAPTLVKKHPKPPKRFIGNLSDRDKIIVGLNLKTHGSADPSSGKTHWIKV
jgi:circadian clock protein KaiB